LLLHAGLITSGNEAVFLALVVDLSDKPYGRIFMKIFQSTCVGTRTQYCGDLDSEICFYFIEHCKGDVRACCELTPMGNPAVIAVSACLVGTGGGLHCLDACKLFLV